MIERVTRYINDVAEHPHRNRDKARQRGVVQGRARRERMLDEARQIHRPKIARAIGWQCLFAARVGRASGFAVEQIIPLIDAVDEDDARLCVIIGRLYDLTPQITGPNGFVYAVVET